MIPYRNIVIDIDETLVKSFDDIASANIFEKSIIYPSVVDRVYHIYRSNNKILWGVVRNHVETFLSYVLNNFDIVVIWSAGIPEYVKVIVRYIFEDIPYPDYVLDQTFCEVDSCSGMWYKPITKLRILCPNINLRNTIIVDDNKYNFIANLSNGVLIPPFTFDPKRPETFPKDDDVLLRLIRWFDSDEFKTAEDVRLLDKRSIFSPIPTRLGLPRISLVV
jgi:TFIIF-interacting CTD phosphatase-like protein